MVVVAVSVGAVIGMFYVSLTARKGPPPPELRLMGFESADVKHALECAKIVVWYEARPEMRLSRAVGSAVTGARDVSQKKSPGRRGAFRG